MKEIYKTIIIKDIVSWEGHYVYTFSYDFDSKSMDMITRWYHWQRWVHWPKH